MIAAIVPTIPAPDPLPQPAPGWLLWFLLMLTFLLHVLPMNFVLGGSVLSALAGRRSGSGNPDHAGSLVRWMGKSLPVAVAAAVTLGVAPLLFLQVLYGRLFFSGSVLMAWSWLAVVPMLILAYYGTYLVAFKGETLGPRAGLVRWSTVALFATIGFFYTNNTTLMLRPERFGEMYRADPRGLSLNLSDPTLVPRYLHFLLGAVAVAGLAVAVYGLVRRRKDPEFGSWAMRRGALWFTIPTAFNMVVGGWWLMTLPADTLSRFLGQDPTATASLAVGVLGSLGAMIMVLRAVHHPAPAPLVRGSAWSLVLGLAGMIVARDQVRRGALETMGFEPVSWVVPQWGNILLFAGLLVAAVACIVWMVSAYARAGETPAAR